MYLPRLTNLCTFVLSTGKKMSYSSIKISYGITVLLFFLSMGLAKGQTLRPGDVNNNGEVNSWDVLYWTIPASDGATGPEREEQSMDFDDPVEIDDDDELWDAVYPNGLNYLYADCNGDGRVDLDDLEVIRMNYGKQASRVFPDSALEANSLLDPQLEFFNSASDIVRLGENVTLTLNLKDGAQNKVNDFWSIAFTIIFEPDYIEDKPNGRDSIGYFIDNATTFLGMAPNEVNFFALQDERPEHFNEFHVVVYRTDDPLENNQSLGDIGKLTAQIVVVEDVVLGKSTLFDISNIILINKDLEQTPVAKGDPKEIEIFELILSEKLKLGNANDVNIFPVPTHEELTVEFKNPAQMIQSLRVIDLQGKTVMEKEIAANTARLNLKDLNPGQYYILIREDDITYIKTISKH